MNETASLPDHVAQTSGQVPQTAELVTALVSLVQMGMSWGARNVGTEQPIAEIIRAEVCRSIGTLRECFAADIRSWVAGGPAGAGTISANDENIATRVAADLLCLFDLRLQQFENGVGLVQQNMDSLAAGITESMRGTEAAASRMLEEMGGVQQAVSAQSAELAKAADAVRERLDSGVAGLAERMKATEAATTQTTQLVEAARTEQRERLDSAVAGITERLGGVEAGASRTSLELSGFGQSAAAQNVQLSELLRRVDQMDSRLARMDEASMSDRIRSYIGEPVSALTPAVADFLNWATGHTGYASQRRLWMNHPLHPSYFPGDVRITYVNERIVELPFALQHAANLPPHSRVIDFGSTESLLALNIAVLGHSVYAVDFRPYALSHPNLIVVSEPGETWEGPGEPVDAIFCISALEHAGIGAYSDTPRPGKRLDIEILERFRTWLKPSGLLIFTAPYGPPSVDALQRTYNNEGIDELFKYWTVDEPQYYRNSPDRYWTRTGPDIDHSENADYKGVILLTARPS